MTRPSLNNVRLRLACGLLLALATAVSFAQTVRPSVTEINAPRSGSVDGSFELANNSLEPLVVTVEAKSFTIDRDGVASFRPLAPELHLQLSETSLRLPPHQRRTVYYRVSAPAYPAWFCIYSNFSSASRSDGMRVQLEMPHTVYLLDRARGSAASLRFASLLRRDGALHGVLQNTGSSVLRVTALETAGAHGKHLTGGFPLLPGGEREFTLSDAADADEVRASTRSFRVVGHVSPGAQ